MPVAAGEVDAREVRGRVALSALSLAPAASALVERRRHLDARRLEQVGAVDDDAGTAVVRHGVDLVVVGAGFEQALQEVVAAEVGDVLGEVG